MVVLLGWNGCGALYFSVMVTNGNDSGSGGVGDGDWESGGRSNGKRSGTDDGDGDGDDDMWLLWWRCSGNRWQCDDYWWDGLGFCSSWAVGANGYEGSWSW